MIRLSIVVAFICSFLLVGYEAVFVLLTLGPSTLLEYIRLFIMAHFVLFFMFLGFFLLIIKVSKKTTD